MSPKEITKSEGKDMESWIREAILSVVPADGSRIGNQNLVQQVIEAAKLTGARFPEDAICTVRDQLITEGVLGKGRGRGGSVYRRDAKEAPADIPAMTGEKGGKPNTGESGAPSPIASAIGPYGSYQHPDEATLRPDVGLQDQFSQLRKPKSYRYDSSLAPELTWDENAEREFAEWLLSLVTEAAERGDDEVFSQPQQWKGSGEVFRSSRGCAARLRSLTQPFLNWAGKAERQQITVATVPLFVHERHSTRAILERLKSYKAAGQNLELFGDPQVDIADKLDAYEFTGPWTNRMILGDSLQVMNSLLEYEGLGGQVQMIYIDPPYGVKFGSNFQPFVRKREVAHGRDNEMIREPEMVKAYRDTWELGLHSYLSYLRDRLLLARELLAESGSVFVQISDETFTEVRSLIHEVFGADNYLVTLIFKKKSATHVTHAVNDFILWAAKDASKFSPTQLYYRRPSPEESGKYRSLISPAGEIKRVNSAKEDEIEGLLKQGWRWARTDYPIVSQHPSKTRSKPYYFEGRDRRCGPNNQWRFDVPEGLDRLAKAGRLYAGRGDSLGGIVFWDDWPYVSYNNVWTDLHGEQRPEYVVQTNSRVIERCVLMATQPGDLILDPTCGSGTTAYVAEQWGRRWITCDTSRVPLALARQRLLTATFPWYELKEPQRGPAGGFVYKRKQNRKGEEVGGMVPRITLKSIANNEEAEMATLVDRPEVNNKVTRVCGRFAVEATIQAAAVLDEQVAAKAGGATTAYENPRAYLDRMVEVLRRAHTLRLPGNQTLALGSVRPMADCEWLHAEANGNGGERIGVSFGPEDGAINSQLVYEAAREAYFLKYDQLYLFGFAIQAKARELVENRAKLRIPCTYVNVTPDVVMTDLLKTSHTDQIFFITGLPDVQIKSAGRREDDAMMYRVAVRGLDTFRPDTMATESVEAENLPCWMLDTDYNGMVFCASQVFFPRTAAWDNLRKSLHAEFDESVWDHLAGTESEPFVMGEQRRVAVKVIDERGNELMVVRSEDEAEQ